VTTQYRDGAHELNQPKGEKSPGKRISKEPTKDAHWMVTMEMNPTQKSLFMAFLSSIPGLPNLKQHQKQAKKKKIERLAGRVTHMVDHLPVSIRP
jgi:hypothetical protein